VSIEAASEPASLPFVSFFADNPHPGPIYWSEPVLATSTYADYLSALAVDIDRSRPLLVDHTIMEFTPKTIEHYALRLTAPSDFGYWYLYEPVEVPAEPTIFLNASGQPTVLPTSTSPAERAAVVEQPNNWNVYGALQTAPDTDGAALYTFPAALPVARVPRTDRVAPIADAPTLRAPVVTEVAPGAWTIDGRIADPYAYVLKFPVVDRAKNAMFVARGEVRNGGVTIGVTQADRWYAVVNITRQGPFTVVLTMPVAGRYEVTVANCVESSLQSALGLVTNAFFQNHVRVSRAGWAAGPR
jgi:hypothetical protein